MLVLRSSLASPFGRKVRMAALHLGFADRFRLELADTNDPADTLRSQNPLGKIPILVLEDGECLFDSRVILEYLDELAGGGRIIPRGPERFPVLRLQALGDGILDAGIAQVYERRYRPEEIAHQPWLDYQAAKVERALDWLEEETPAARVDVGTLAVAAALGYLDFRFSGAWRAGRPGLVAWLDDFADRVPAFGETVPA